MSKPANAPVRRKRSELSTADCLTVFRDFSRRMVRFGETSDPSMYAHPTHDGLPAMGPGHINVQVLVRGSFGSNDDFFEAMRVLAGYKLPRDAATPPQGTAS